MSGQEQDKIESLSQHLTAAERHVVVLQREIERLRRQTAGHLANVNDYVSRLIGAERGLCRCCGRAHAIQHDDDCPVPHLIHLTTGAQEADPERSNLPPSPRTGGEEG